MLRTLAFVAALAGSAIILSAQAIDPDTFKVNYFSGAHTAGNPDGTVRITNAGTSGGDECANIAVFDANQEMSECCSCKVTPDGLLTLSVNSDLTGNPLTGVTLTSGIIKILSGKTFPGGTCEPPILSLAELTAAVAPGIHAWGTHIQNLSTGGYQQSEADFGDAGLSAAELKRLYNGCIAILTVGSGHGICSCGSGG